MFYTTADRYIITTGPYALIVSIYEMAATNPVIAVYLSGSTPENVK